LDDRNGDVYLNMYIQRLKDDIWLYECSIPPVPLLC